MNSPRNAAWVPDTATVQNSNLAWLMDVVGVAEYADLHQWSVDNRKEFWALFLDRLGISFQTPPDRILEGTAQNPTWLPGARMNIVTDALGGRHRDLAIVHGTADQIERVTVAELRHDVARCGNGLLEVGVEAGSTVAIVMPMIYEAVVAYLATVAIGAVVVSIADSFAPEEISTRLEIAKTDWAVTQHASTRAGKVLPMYEKVVAAGAERIIVVPGAAGPPLRPEDIWWADLLSDHDRLTYQTVDADANSNILFSSGTTGDPKAIPWTHTTPLKCAMDGHFHHDIHPNDVVAWPTNLGWMMGPWLIYAALLNNATLALYDDVPTGIGFAQFVERAGVTVLGVVPSLVAAWRGTGVLEEVDWSGIRLFSSTGEASNPDDMAYLMAAAGGRPVIEYCGGTEIGGGYVAGTVLQPAIPGTFTTPALGLDLVLVDDTGAVADEGEVMLVPPSIGLSTSLLNRDHDEVYYSGLPDLGRPLRRHGDHMERLPNGYWRALGRVDDTMNLGGIKISSAELERTIDGVVGVSEVAAIAVPPAGGGPDRLVIYAVAESGAVFDPDVLKAEMQQAIRSHLNPLFKVHDVVMVAALARTASAKVMRRSLRSSYEEAAE
ncbi:MAG: AMP-binding protein [bacterium]|nr:AMP-binding protein [bacterium]